jgi:hypothetical protein
MNCDGCNSNSYRKLCNYDDENNTCEQPPHMLGLFSYMCILQENKNVCILVQEPPNSSLGRYSTMEQCSKNCLPQVNPIPTPVRPIPTPVRPIPTPVTPFSYKVVYTNSGPMCVKMNMFPDSSAGRYKTVDECVASMGTGRNPRVN